MDIARCLDRIRPNAQWGTATTYADLQRTWRDTEQTIPTEAELDTAWQTLQAEDVASASASEALSNIRLALSGKISLLDDWAQDASDVVNGTNGVTAWNTQTQTQKNNTLRVLIDRLGKILSNMADIIRTR